MVFLFDFDDTLFNTAEFKKELQRIFSRGGVKSKIFQQSYRWAKKSPGGYQPEKQIAILAKIQPNLKRQKTSSAIKKFLAGPKNFVYPDALSFLEKIKKEKHRLILITYGSEFWQKTKIKKSGLAHFFVKIITSDDLTKTGPLRKILPNLKNQPIVFVENNKQAIALVKKNWPQILTVQLRRPGALFKTSGKSQADFNVKNFKGLLAKINHASLKG